jgi:hypothetical protein
VVAADAVVAADVEVLHLPTRWVLAHYRPMEGATWQEVAEDFAANHGHIQALTDSIRTHGVRTPLQVDGAGRVRRGHHRLILAAEVDAPTVPVVFAYLDEATLWDPVTDADVADDDPEWDDDEPWTDRVFPVPSQARAVALPSPANWSQHSA